ncbi:hypothetical protein [Neomoorella thermoacetica]|uniref:Uncharacterized protein n=1 Tax=Neomoorella thermoacetica TaxID=1525 RepID=A0A1J5JZJ9_NEOTH|nr:hypothetical protein [Moorella thermoacetica]OIQ08937.1 hypothetical protein MOOR_13340 [Moorella thermoacetica]OIQ11164.1 hypothetical protein MOOTH_18960 [Moorella thermoacetica]
MIALIILAFLVIAYLDAPGLWQKKEWRELAVMGIVWSLGLALSLGLAFHLPVPSPAKMLARFFGPVTSWLTRLIG